MGDGDDTMLVARLAQREPDLASRALTGDLLPLLHQSADEIEAVTGASFPPIARVYAAAWMESIQMTGREFWETHRRMMQDGAFLKDKQYKGARITLADYQSAFQG